MHQTTQRKNVKSWKQICEKFSMSSSAEFCFLESVISCVCRILYCYFRLMAISWLLVWSKLDRITDSGLLLPPHPLIDTLLLLSQSYASDMPLLPFAQGFLLQFTAVDAKDDI